GTSKFKLGKLIVHINFFYRNSCIWKAIGPARNKKATPSWDYSKLLRISYRLCWTFFLSRTYFGSVYSGSWRSCISRTCDGGFCALSSKIKVGLSIWYYLVHCNYGRRCRTICWWSDCRICPLVLYTAFACCNDYHCSIPCKIIETGRGNKRIF